MYSPVLGRFIERDPIESDLNLYRYVGNNPPDATDPAGLATFNDLLGKKQCVTMSRAAFQAWVTRNIYTLTREPTEGVGQRMYWFVCGQSSVRPRTGPYENMPEDAPGTQCYLSEAEANQRKCPNGQTNFVFEKIGQWRNSEAPKPGKDGTIPNDSIVGVGSDASGETNDWNYVTSFDGLYFWMNNCKEVGPQTVTICRKPPVAKSYMWCSTCKCQELVATFQPLSASCYGVVVYENLFDMRTGCCWPRWVVCMRSSYICGETRWYYGRRQGCGSGKLL